MSKRRPRLVTFAAATIAFGLVAAGCLGGGGIEPTPIVIVTTLPSATPEATPTPEPTPEPTPSEEPSGSALPSATPTAAATATPAPATPVPPGGLTGVENCTGSATIKAFFTEVASKVSWAVYCAKLPSGWGVKPPDGLNYGLPSSGSWMTGIYVKSGGATITIKEGNYGANVCATNTGSLGTGSFGPLSGSFYTISGGYAICVNPGTKKAYEISGTGVTQATFTQVAANMVLVPKA